MFHAIPSHPARRADDPIFALNREATQRKKRGDAIVNATAAASPRSDDSSRSPPRASFVVPQTPPKGRGTLRVALCSVAERDVARLVDALA